MKRTMIALALVSSLSLEARADVVTDRVLLMTGASGCPSGQSFRRLKQLPDGSQTLETTEFQVPAGKLLEVTDVEYTLPMYLPWAAHYTQSIDLNIRNRTSFAGTNVVALKYGNRAVYSMDENNQLDPIGDYVAPGAQTNVVSFSSGPLMSNAARLCLSVANNFNIYGGSVRVRGRLIPNPDVTGGMSTSPSTNY